MRATAIFAICLLVSQAFACAVVGVLALLEARSLRAAGDSPTARIACRVAGVLILMSAALLGVAALWDRLLPGTLGN